MRLVITIVLVMNIVGIGYGQTYLDTIVDIRGTGQDLNLDGFLDEPLWQTATVFPFVEWQPEWGKKDTLSTMYLTFDEAFLYVGLDAMEANPEKIIARNLIRDGWYGDDYFAFQIDPNRTQKNAFVFSIYPTGARYDMSISNDNVTLGNATQNVSYDMIWEGKSQITATGWQAEYRIPLSNLRFEVRAGEVLGGISAQRSINHGNKLMVYPKIARDIEGANGKPSLKQPVRFVGLRPKKDLQISPYLLGSSRSAYPLANDGISYDKILENHVDAGLDVRYGITASLTLDLTLNTDFSQVEIDDQVVNLSRASIFLPEKRKFFQEQAGLFDFSLGPLSQLFYSRTIGINSGELVPILGGARLTGELGDWDVGLLSLQTEGTRINNRSLPTENFSVLRLRRQVFNERSFLGVMATNRIRNDNVNTALGIDGLIDLGNNNFLLGAVASAIEKDTLGGSGSKFDFFDDSRIFLQFHQQKQDGFFFRGSYEHSGQSFNPGMGILLREKHQNLFLFLNHGKFKNSKSEGLFQYRRWTLLNSDVYLTPDFSKVLTYLFRPAWRGRFFSGDQIDIFGQLEYELLQEPLVLSRDVIIPTGDYFFKYFGASYSPGTQRALKIPFGAEFGEFYDGTNLQLNISPEWNVNEHLTLESSWRANHLNFNDRNVSKWIHLPQIQLKWAYNLHLSGSIITQYNSLADQVFTSARLRYNFKDGHDLYLVYNQDYNSMRNFGMTRLPYYNNRNFTLKYSYTFIR